MGARPIVLEKRSKKAERESAETLLQAAAARRIEAIEPRLVEIDGKLWLDTGTGS